MIQSPRRLAIFSLILIAFGSAAFAKDSKKAAAEIDRLQGTWVADLEPDLQARLELKGSDLRLIHVRRKKVETVIWDGQFSINEKAQPKQMDWTPLRRGNREVSSSLAIYQLKGDLLLIVGDTEGPRPQAFYSGGGSQRPKTIIFQRQAKEVKRRDRKKQQ